MSSRSRRVIPFGISQKRYTESFRCNHHCPADTLFDGRLLPFPPRCSQFRGHSGYHRSVYWHWPTQADLDDGAIHNKGFVIFPNTFYRYISWEPLTVRHTLGADTGQNAAGSDID
jgi:hypothetical protein